jgi:subtilisin family serine protease
MAILESILLHRRFILSLLCTVFISQVQASGFGQFQSAEQLGEHFRIIQTKSGELIKEPLQVLPDGQQRYIIELAAPTLLEQIRQQQQLLAMDPTLANTSTTTSAIAAPVLLQINQQLQAEQQELVNELEQHQLITQTFARTYTLVNTLVVAAKPEDLVKIAAIPSVKKIHPDRELELHLNSSVRIIGADQVWNKTDANNQPLRGKGIRVGVIDTGIDYTHPDLGGCFGEGCKVAGGYDFYDNDADPMDTDSHGTHVAGIIAANGTVKGVAPEATLYAYRVCARYCPTSYIVQALERAADPDQNPLTQDALDVVNLSLGGPGDMDDMSTIAANNASRAGIVVVISAGNKGKIPNAVGAPGNAELAITVAASDSEDKIADFSSRGPSVSDVVFKPDLAAPGDYIRSTTPNSQYNYLSGTSMAAPHVAGAAALLKQQQKSRTPAQIKSLLVNSAKDLQHPITAQGSGRLDVMAAANATLTFSPQSISFGKLDSSKSLWVQQKPLVLHNTAATSSTVKLELPTLPAGVTLTMTPASTVTIAAGASQEIQLQLSVNPAIYQQPADGAIVEDLLLTVRNEQATYRLALAFLAYHQASISSSQYINLLQIYDVQGTRIYNDTAWDGMSLRMPAGTYDLIARFSNGAQQRIVVLEQQVINQQQTLTIDPGLAVHKINLASVTDRDGAIVPLDELAGGVHALEIRHAAKPVYFLQMYGVLGNSSWGFLPGPRLTEGQQLLISPFSDKFQLAVAAFWRDRRSASDDIQLYSWTQRFTGMHSGEVIQLNATTQNRLVTQIAAASFTQEILFGYQINRNLKAYDLAREDWNGVVGLSAWLPAIAANQSAKVSIFGTAASLKPHYGVGLFHLSFSANKFMNYVDSGAWRFYDDKGVAVASPVSRYGSYLNETMVYSKNPQGFQYLTLIPHWVNFWSSVHYSDKRIDVTLSNASDIYGSRIRHDSTPEFPVHNSALLRCDHRPGTAQQSEKWSFTFDIACSRYDVELNYTTALIDQPTPSFSRQITFTANHYNRISLSEVRLGYDDQPTQEISQGTGFFELSGAQVDAVSAEIHYQGKWWPLSMQLNTSNAESLPVYRAEFPLPNTAALASVRYIAKNNNGNSLESVFHNAAIIGPNPETARLLDHDKDGIPDYQDPDDDNDGISDINELRYRLDIYKDDRHSDLDNDGLSNLQELELLTFPDQADSDSDGMQDGYEHKYGLNPLDSSDALLDQDKDGLTNLQEFSHKTDPTKADTDGDTLPDGWEVQYGFNPLDASNATLDPDQDGLDNLSELQHNTNPVKADTDNDGLPDGWELKYGFNPLDGSTAVQDPDHDQLNNLQELQQKTDPTKADTDGDTLPDGWEVRYNLNPLDPSDASSDRDNDGATALQEFSRGTDPTVSNLVSKPVTPDAGSSGGGSVGWSMLLLLLIAGWRRRLSH